MILNRLIFISLTAVLSMNGCAPVGGILKPEVAIPSTTAQVLPVQSPSSVAPAVRPAFTASAGPPLTQVPFPIETVSTPQPASPIPTYAILFGVVVPEKVSCRYGPGAMYLYLYGMVRSATQDVIGRTDTGKWVLTRSRGDTKSCWVKADLLDIKGDVMTVEVVYPDKYLLPQSNQGYRPPWDVVAIRNGNQVTISWKSEPLRPGDAESPTSVLYITETWVCQGGDVFFNPVGSFVAQVTVIDEPGCKQPSHGRVFFAEKHGYAGPTYIHWPPAK